jgi:hypothetical protein
MSGDRFPIKIGMMGPFLKLIKVNKEAAHVDLAEEELTVTFGYVGAKIAYDNVEAVEKKGWNILYGLGLRPALGGTLGYISAAGDAVWITLKEAQDLKVGPGSVTMSRTKVAISMEDPDGFVAALEQRRG